MAFQFTEEAINFSAKKVQVDHSILDLKLTCNSQEKFTKPLNNTNSWLK